MTKWSVQKTNTLSTVQTPRKATRRNIPVKWNTFSEFLFIIIIYKNDFFKKYRVTTLLRISTV